MVSGRVGSADLPFKVCGSSSFQMRVFSSAGKRTLSMRRAEPRSCSAPATPAYSCTPDHFQSVACSTSPRRTAFR